MEWLDELPEWLQPVAIGAGALVVLAIIRVVFFIPSILAEPSIGIPAALLAIVIAAAGGAVAGLGYSLVGRPLRRVPFVGRYLAGIVSAAAYLIPLGLFLPYAFPEDSPRVSSDPAFVVILLGMSVFWGLIIGHWWFEEPV